MDDLYALILYVWDVLVWIANFFWSLFLYIWQFFVYIADFLWGTLKAVFGFAWSALSKVGNFFRHIWDNFFKKIFLKVMNAITKVHQWLEAKLRPIIDFLKKVRAWYDRFYKQYIRPILNMLQKIRKILQILRFLHIKWAQELDKKIAQLEGKISAIFMQIRGILNSTIDFLNALADPLRLLRHPTLVLSFRRIINGVIRVVTGRPPGYFFPSPRKGVKAALGPIPHTFNFTDPMQNPLASSYLDGNDGLNGFNGFAPGEEPPNSAVDDLDLLDFYDDELWDLPLCTDPKSCYMQLVAEQRERLANA